MGNVEWNVLTKLEKALVALYEKSELKDSKTLLTKYAIKVLCGRGVAKNPADAGVLLKQFIADTRVTVYETKMGRNGYTHVQWTEQGIAQARAIIKSAEEANQARLKRPDAPPDLSTEEQLRRRGERRGCVLVDYDNHAIPLHHAGITSCEIAEKIFRRLNEIAEKASVFNPDFYICTCTGYINQSESSWGDLQKLTNGMPNVHLSVVPTGKDAADVELKKTADELYRRRGFSHFFIAGGDGYFISLVEFLCRNGKEVTLIPITGHMHMNYDNLRFRFPNFHIQYLDRLFVRQRRVVGEEVRA